MREADLERKREAEERLRTTKAFVKEEQERREVIRKQKERLDLEIRTAVRIQAWWRMTMVRRGLGHFRKKKAAPTQTGSGAGKKGKK